MNFVQQAAAKRSQFLVVVEFIVKETVLSPNNNTDSKQTNSDGATSVLHTQVRFSYRSLGDWSADR